MAVILEHRPAAGDVDDDRVDVAMSRRPPGWRRPTARAGSLAGVKVDRPAADLSGGTNTSQPFCCNTRAVAQCVGRNIASATQPVKNATRARRLPIGRQKRRQRRTRTLRRRQHSTSRRSRGGNSRVSPSPLGQRHQPQPLGDPRGNQHASHPTRDA